MTATDILEALFNSFSRIGRTQTTKFPEHLVKQRKGATNEEASEHVEREKRLYEYMIADALQSLAKKRKDEAKRHCELSGDFDFEIGLTPSNKRDYTGDTLDVVTTMSRPSTKVDLEKFSEQLRIRGVHQSIIDSCIKSASSLTSARKYRTFTPK